MKIIAVGNKINSLSNKYQLTGNDNQNSAYEVFKNQPTKNVNLGNNIKFKEQFLTANDLGNDKFQKSDVSFKGYTGGIIGAVAGEILALKLIDLCNIPGIFWPVATFFLGIAGFGLLGDILENKIDTKKNSQATKENSDRPC